MNRRDFPLVQRLNNFKFDISALTDNLKQIQDHFTDVKSSNGALCLNNEELTSSVYDHYEQVNLTLFNHQKAASFRHQDPYRLKLAQHFFHHNQMDEYLYDLPSELYRNSYFQSVIEQIPGNTIRVRLVKLRDGREIPYHVDYDIRYATRLVIPIKTNSKVKNLFIKDSKEHEFHLQADGSVYFLNVGYSHSVINEGNEERVVLMFSKDSYDFLESL
jgi:aspartyl/asparaginyl beta-hydroxylase (cupin superfamily)